MRIVALVTRDAVEELGSRRHVRNGHRQVDERDGAELMKRLSSVVGLLGSSPLRRPRRPPTEDHVYAASSLVNAFPAINPNETYSFAGSNTLRRRSRTALRRTFRLGKHDAAGSAPQAGILREAGRLHAQHARDRRPKANPGHVKSIYSLTKSASPSTSRRRASRSGRTPSRSSRTRPEDRRRGERERRQPGDERRRRAGSCHERRGRRGLRLRTDARSVPGQVKVIRIPAWAQPKVQYGICVVTASANKAAAHAFISLVLSKKGQAKLREFGFLPRVKPRPKQSREGEAMREKLGAGLFVVLAAVTVLFLALPIVGTSSIRAVEGHRPALNPVVVDAFVVTLKTSLVAQALILFFGTPTAYLIATRRFTGRSLAITLVELPLVLPPAVAGIGLLVVLRAATGCSAQVIPVLDVGHEQPDPRHGRRQDKRQLDERDRERAAGESPRGE